MKTYKIDPHIHTSEVSPCGKVAAAKITELYKKAGYDAIVITDHYSENWYFRNLRDISWNKKIDCFLKGYRKAHKRGREIGLNVILGIELSFNDLYKDYLVYGIDEDYLYDNPELYNYSLEEFKAHKMTSSMMIYQAHPYRNFLGIHSHECLDGIEVYNGNPRHESYNDIAYEFAEKHSLGKISGSDFHQNDDLGAGGIITTINPSDSMEFTELLRNDKTLKLITNSAL